MLTALPSRHDGKTAGRIQNLAKRAALNRATRPSPYGLPNFDSHRLVMASFYSWLGDRKECATLDL